MRRSHHCFAPLIRLSLLRCWKMHLQTLYRFDLAVSSCTLRGCARVCRFVVWSKETIACQRVCIKREIVYVASSSSSRVHPLRVGRRRVEGISILMAYYVVKYLLKEKTKWTIFIKMQVHVPIPSFLPLLFRRSTVHISSSSSIQLPSTDSRRK